MKYILRCIFVLVLVFLLFLFAGCDTIKNMVAPSAIRNGPSRASVWMGANVATPDFIDLFRKPELWPQARNSIGVFQFHHAQLLSNPPQPMTGMNTFDALSTSIPGGPFLWLQNQGMLLSVETGAVKEWNCGPRYPDDLISGALDALNNVRSAGGTMTYLAMDDPFASGLVCNDTIEQTIAKIKYFIDGVHGAFPNLQIGLTENYPLNSVVRIGQALNGLQNIGAQLAFLHLDWSLNLQSDIDSDLKTIKGYCQQLGIPFGVIIYGANGSSNGGFFSDSVKMATTIMNTVGRPDQIVFESWSSIAGIPDSRTYPFSLPESDPTSMTGMVNTLLPYFQ